MKLHLGDCLEVMKQIPDKSVDLVLADLPYGTTVCKWDAVIPFDNLWAEYRRITKKGAAIALFASQPFTSALVMSNPKEFRYEWVWKKNAGSNFGLVKYQPMKEHESVLIFGRESPRYFPIKQERAESGKARIKTPVKYDNASEHRYISNKRVTSNICTELRYPSSVQPFNRERGLHPTQKPVALCEYLIKTYTQEGETVMDNTMGSGTTGVACANLNRHFIGIEKEPQYFEVAKKRIFTALPTFEKQFSEETPKVTQEPK